MRPTLLLAALTLMTPTLSSTAYSAAPPVPVIPLRPPAAPEIKLHPRQPELTDLRQAPPEHGPSYTPPQDQFVALFTPFRTDRAALSPDGKYLAYTVRENGSVAVVIVEIDHPEKATAKVVIATDETSTPMMAANQEEKTPALVRWMRWTSPTRLVVDTNGAFAINSTSEWATRTGAVFGVDADGKNRRLLVSPRDVLESMPDETVIKPTVALNQYANWAPDQPLPSATADPANETNVASAGLSDNPFVSPSSGPPQDFVITSAQDIRVFDLAPDKPDFVLLETMGSKRASGERHVGFLLVNANTGKLEHLTDDIVPGLSQGLTDRAGHLRITLPVGLVVRFPHRYEYLGVTGGDRPRDLDDIAGFSSNAGFTVSPETFFGERAIPLGFDERPEILYYAANFGRDTFGIYSLDLKTRQRGAFTFENPSFDLVPPIASFGDGTALVFDRFTHRLAGIRYDATVTTAAWVNPTLQSVQKAAESALPGHSIDILEWDQEENRFLLLASSPGDAGAFYLFDRKASRLAEFVRRAPWIDAKQSQRTYAFTFTTKANLPLMGVMTLPNHPRLMPAPVILICPDLPWQRVRPRFSDRVAALADMGFVVVQLNGRGAWGFGLKRRQALAAGYDEAQVEDLMAALDHVAEHFKIDPKRVALLGNSEGGFVALRALQLHPDRFRCAIAIDAPVDLGAWLDEKRWSDGDAGPLLTRTMLGDAAHLEAAPLVHHPEAITKPVLLLQYPGLDGTPRPTAYLAAKGFASAVRRNAPDTEFVDLPTDYMRGFPQARSDTYQKIEDFLNVTVYDYKVKVGKPRVQPDVPQKR